MKFIDKYRNKYLVEQYAAAITQTRTQPWTVMEVCGGQTHSIIKYGIDELLSEQITLLHGPGCPVCVTSIELIDQAIALALNSNIIFCSFGDMLRVPGSQTHLLAAKAQGGDIRIVYSPLDALKIAQKYPKQQVVFFAVGFETTAPASAMLAYQAWYKKIKNISLLVSHVLVPPAMRAIIDSRENQIQGFLAAGHVCTVMGYKKEYEKIAYDYQIPIVITGFEPVDILQGLYLCGKQIEAKQAYVENQYKRVVSSQGNLIAQKLVEQFFEVTSVKWRGIGTIPNSGLKLRDEYAELDAKKRFQIVASNQEVINECISGLVLQGLKTPKDCPAFGTRCLPEHPLGAPMVSSEGACAAYYRYRKDYKSD